MQPVLAPHLLLEAYHLGVFPMADEDGQLRWFSPDPRAIIELDRFHVPRTLRQVYRQGRFDVSVDTAFERVKKPGKILQPDKELTSFYAGCYETYKMVYPALRPVSHRVFDQFKK